MLVAFCIPHDLETILYYRKTYEAAQSNNNVSYAIPRRIVPHPSPPLPKHIAHRGLVKLIGLYPSPYPIHFRTRLYLTISEDKNFTHRTSRVHNTVARITEITAFRT